MRKGPLQILFAGLGLSTTGPVPLQLRRVIPGCSSACSLELGRLPPAACCSPVTGSCSAQELGGRDPSGVFFVQCNSSPTFQTKELKTGINKSQGSSTHSTAASPGRRGLCLQCSLFPGAPRREPTPDSATLDILVIKALRFLLVRMSKHCSFQPLFDEVQQSALESSAALELQRGCLHGCAGAALLPLSFRVYTQHAVLPTS